MGAGKKRIYEHTCAQCSKKWRSSLAMTGNAPQAKICAWCRAKNRDSFQDRGLSALEVEMILQRAIADEIRMPWERRNRTHR